MNEDNDLLLQQFFSEARQQQIADNGFTERVMQSLPERPVFSMRRFTRLWNLFFVVLFVVLFVAFRGWELLAIHFEVMLRTLTAESFSINPLMLAAVLFGLLFVGAGEAVSRA